MIIVSYIYETLIVYFFPSQLLNPIEFLDEIVEHEYVECTASTIQAFVLFKKLHPKHRKREIDSSIRNAVKYIEDTQRPNGSWYGSLNMYYYNYYFGSI